MTKATSKFGTEIISKKDYGFAWFTKYEWANDVHISGGFAGTRELAIKAIKKRRADVYSLLLDSEIVECGKE